VVELVGIEPTTGLLVTATVVSQRLETIQRESRKPQSDLAISKEAKQASTDLNSIKHLIERLKRGPNDRAQFVDSHVNKGIAYQIRALRDRQGLSQQELAKLTGMNQNAISRLESPNRGRPTISTLKRLAEALDVALVVRFAPFSNFAKWYSGTPYVEHGISTEGLAVPSFTEELNDGTFSHAATHQWLYLKHPSGFDEMLLAGSFADKTPLVKLENISTGPYRLPPQSVGKSTKEYLNGIR
jgi:transcriptional regulator with XRE-family HTH domain